MVGQPSFKMINIGLIFFAGTMLSAPTYAGLADILVQHDSAFNRNAAHWDSYTAAQSKQNLVRQWTHYVYQAGLRKTPGQYTREAREFCGKYRKKVGEALTLSDGSRGTIIEASGKGGYFKQGCKVVKFWYN